MKTKNEKENDQNSRPSEPSCTEAILPVVGCPIALTSGIACVVGGHCFPRLIFNFTPTNLPSFSKSHPGFFESGYNSRLNDRNRRATGFKPLDRGLSYMEKRRLVCSRPKISRQEWNFWTQRPEAKNPPERPQSFF
jgi:hypothetical protein